jgi:hypothetical protein
MQRILLNIIVAAALAAAGCAAMNEWTAGRIDEGIPKLRQRLPRTVKVHFSDPVNTRGVVLHERTRKQVQAAFCKAFDELGVQCSPETNGCTHVISVVVGNWEYSDSGFFGPGDRDEISMAVMLQNAETQRVVSRASLHARNLDLLVIKYVKTLFDDGK